MARSFLNGKNKIIIFNQNTNTLTTFLLNQGKTLILLWKTDCLFLKFCIAIPALVMNVFLNQNLILPLNNIKIRPTNLTKITSQMI